MIIPPGQVGLLIGLRRDRVVHRQRLDPSLVWKFRRIEAGWGYDVKWKDKSHTRICPLCRKAELPPRKRLCEQCRIYKRNLTFHRVNVKRGRVPDLPLPIPARTFHAMRSLAE